MTPNNEREKDDNPLFDELEQDCPRSDLVYTTDGELRPRGIFSKKDRKYLIGELEPADRFRESDKRGNRVKWIKNAMADFQLLSYLDDRTTERIFEDTNPAALHDTLRDIIAFYYANVPGNHPDELIRDAVEAGVYKGERQRRKEQNRRVSVEVNIDRGANIDVAREHLEQGDYSQLTPQQIGVLVQEGDLNEDDLQRLRDLEYPPTPEQLMDESD